MEVVRGLEDFNYLMKDESIKHFEFQSTNEGLAGLKRFRLYEAQKSYQYKKPVTTYVLFSGTIKEPMTEFSEGINTYRVVPIVMQHKNADEVIANLQGKLETGEEITKADLLPLVLCPLMGGILSQKDRMTAAYNITRQATKVNDDVIKKVEAVLYIMADKFLDEKEMEQFKEEMKTMRLGRMLCNDGAQMKLKELVAKKVKKGYSVAEIATLLEEDKGVIEDIVKELESV